MPDQADVIIVLGCGTNTPGTASPCQVERTRAGVDLWKAQYAPKIILTGGDTGNGIESEYMASEALKEDVPADNLVLEKRSHSTVENLRYSKQILQLHGWQSVILVSDPYHLYRARQQAKDQGIKVTGWWPTLKSPDWQGFWDRTSGMVRDALSLMIYESLGWLLYR